MASPVGGGEEAPVQPRGARAWNPRPGGRASPRRAPAPRRLRGPGGAGGEDGPAGALGPPRARRSPVHLKRSIRHQSPSSEPLDDLGGFVFTSLSNFTGLQARKRKGTDRRTHPFADILNKTVNVVTTINV